jgi:integrase
MAKAFTKLDRLSIRKLQQGQSITENGITFLRMPNGDGVYEVAIMVDGVRIHRVVGRESEGVTRTHAETYIEKVRTEAREDRLTLPKGRKVALSFRDAAGKYLIKLGECGGKNIDTKKQHLEQHCTPFFGDLPLNKIGSFDIERYKKHRLSQVVQSGGDWKSGKRVARDAGRTTAPGTVNRELATLSHLFSQATEWRWLTTAKPKMKRLKEGDGRIIYLTSEQVQQFQDAAKASDCAQLYPFVFLALQTSMRMSEVLSIAREDIDLDRMKIHIPKAKAGARDQPITEDVAVFLKRYLSESVPVDSKWLFPSNKNSASGHTMTVTKPFRAAAIEAGLDPAKVVRHTLRHTAITHLVQSGVDLPTVKRISGHKTLAMVERYSHQSGEHIQAAMQKLQNRVGQVKIA